MKDFYWFEFWRLAICFGPRVPQFWHQPGVWIGYRTKGYVVPKDLWGVPRKFKPRFDKHWEWRL